MPDRALRLAEAVGLDEDARGDVYYTALLVNVGCNTDAHEQAKWFGDDIALKATKYEHEPFSVGDMIATLKLLGSNNRPVHRFKIGIEFAVAGRRDVDDMISQHAAMAAQLARDLGLSDGVVTALGGAYEASPGGEIGFEGAYQLGAAPLVIAGDRAERGLEEGADIAVAGHQQPDEAEFGGAGPVPTPVEGHQRVGAATGLGVGRRETARTRHRSGGADGGRLVQRSAQLLGHPAGDRTRMIAGQQQDDLGAV